MHASSQGPPIPRRAGLAWALPGLAALVLSAASVRDVGSPASAGPARLLMVSHSAAFQHDVVRRPAPDRLSVAEEVVSALGRDSGAFSVTHLYSRDDLTGLTPETLRGVQGLLFFTTGNLPMAPDVRQALFDRIRAGGGFIGVHSASDTWYDLPEYGDLVGGYFDGHPWHERVRVLVEQRTHPATRHLGEAFEITDEIYQFRGWSRSRVEVLLRLDPRSVDIRKGKRPDGDYALAWARSYGKGRVFYTALGHRPEVWSDPRFRQHLLGGIRWALRQNG